MPKKLKVLSGDEVIKMFGKEGFELSFGKGSHCKLTRMINGEKQVIVLPRHDVIAKGTLKAIYTKAIQYIPEDTLRKLFYTD